MTPLERLNARLSAIYPSTRRASARNAEVRSNSDGDRNNTSPKTQNGSAFSHGTGLYVLPSLHSPAFRHTPTHLPPIEFP